MRIKVIVEVEGGVVQQIYCDDTEVEVVLIDWDVEPCSDGTDVVHDQHGREFFVRAIDFPTTPASKMSQDTRQAVGLVG